MACTIFEPPTFQSILENINKEQEKTADSLIAEGINVYEFWNLLLPTYNDAIYPVLAGKS